SGDENGGARRRFLRRQDRRPVSLDGGAQRAGAGRLGRTAECPDRGLSLAPAHAGSLQEPHHGTLELSQGFTAVPPGRPVVLHAELGTAAAERVLHAAEFHRSRAPRARSKRAFTGWLDRREWILTIAGWEVSRVWDLRRRGRLAHAAR